MNLDEPVRLSAAGREAVERELRLLLRNRRGMREHRSRAIRDGFGADTMLMTTDRRCLELCRDLGLANEAEAAYLLLDNVLAQAACHQAPASNEEGPVGPMRFESVGNVQIPITPDPRGA